MRWTVVFSDPQHMMEIANAAEEDLSFREAMKDVRPLLSLQLTTVDTVLEIMGVDDALKINVDSPDHDLLAELLKSHIARNATKISNEVQDELLASLENVLGSESDGKDASLQLTKRSITLSRLDLYSCFGHRQSNNGADMATILCGLSPMYVLWSVLSKILTMFCRPQLRVVFLSGQDSQGCGDLERDQTSCAIMDIPVSH